MHAISEGFVYVFYTSIAMNACFILYFMASLTDKEESE